MKTDDRKQERANKFNRHKKRKQFDREPKIKRLVKKSKYKLSVNDIYLPEEN